MKLCLGPLGGDLVAELPFVLMHPKPEEEEPSSPAHADDANSTTDGHAKNASNKSRDGSEVSSEFRIHFSCAGNNVCGSKKISVYLTLAVTFIQ